MNASLVRGLSRTDGKRPDGLTLVPWERDRSLLWDFSCVNTVADSNVRPSSEAAGKAAEAAAQRKETKYKHLMNAYIFVPVVIESHGVLCKDAQSFIAKIGSKLAQTTGEPKSKEYIRQSISMTLQRGNVRCVLDTTGVSKEPQVEDDIFTNL